MVEMVEMTGTHFRNLINCDIMFVSVQNYDHAYSVAKVIMTIKKGLEEVNQFTLTRSEYANEIGKTPNAVRMMMRHGKLTGEYRFDGSKYIFRAPERPRENYDNDLPIITKMTTPKKRKINRGNHFNANYPNESMRLFNENKKRVSELNKLQGKFKSKEQEIEFNKLNDEALIKAQENVEKKEKASFSPLKNYGGPVSLRPAALSYDRDDYNPPSTPRTPFRGYDSMGSYDDGSVEIDVSRYSGNSVINEPRFKSKVAESIWRLKNKK